MSYFTTLNNLTVKKKTVTVGSFFGVNSLKSERLTDADEAVECYNFSTRNGGLTDGDGIEELTLNGKTFPLPAGVYPLKIYYYPYIEPVTLNKKDKLLVYGSDGSLYLFEIYDNKERVKLGGATFSSPPSAVTYNYDDTDVLIISGEGEGTYILKNDALTPVPDAPDVTSLCVQSERLIVASPEGNSKLWFSEDFNPENWNVSLTEAGYVELYDALGKIKRVVGFNGYAYVFKEYGIYRLYLAGAQSDFSVSCVLKSGSYIYGDSVTVCGDFITYMTDDGIYAFNGLSASKISGETDGFLRSGGDKTACGEYLNGNLYLLINVKIKGSKKPIIFKYDFYKKRSEILLLKPFNSICKILTDGDGIIALSAKNEKRLLKIGGKGLCLKENVEKYYKSGKLDFNILQKIKVLKKVKIYSEEEATFTLISEYGEKSFTLKSGLNELNASLKGETFTYIIKSERKNSLILKPTFYLTYLGE